MEFVLPKFRMTHGSDQEIACETITNEAMKIAWNKSPKKIQTEAIKHVVRKKKKTLVQHLLC